MSQQNNHQGERRLPTGGALEWDMTQLTDAQLEHEYQLAYESMYGHTINGVVVIPGFRSPDFDPQDIYWVKDHYDEALAVWTLRLERAEQELERRYLLS